MVYYSRFHTSPMLVRTQVGIRYEKGQDILVSRNWKMSREKQLVAKVQSQQRSHSYTVLENCIVSQKTLVHARFRERAQDYGARAYPSGSNDREYDCMPFCQYALLLCNLQRFHNSNVHFAIGLTRSLAASTAFVVPL